MAAPLSHPRLPPHAPGKCAFSSTKRPQHLLPSPPTMGLPWDSSTPVKNSVWLHLQEKLLLVFLRGFPPRFLLPPLLQGKLLCFYGAWQPDTLAPKWQNSWPHSPHTPQNPVPLPLAAKRCCFPQSFPGPASQKLPPQQCLFALLRAACCHSQWRPRHGCSPQDGCFTVAPDAPHHPCRISPQLHCTTLRNPPKL